MDTEKHIEALLASGLTIQAIADKAAVNRATVYRAWAGGGMNLATAQKIMAVKPLRARVVRRRGGE